MTHYTRYHRALLKLVVGLSLILLQVGCAISNLQRINNPTITTSQHPWDERYARLTTQEDRLQESAFSEPKVIEDTKRFWILALLANNSYAYSKDKPKYIIPNWPVPERWESPSGLAFDLYRNAPLDGQSALIIAFEGTNGVWNRDMTTNLSIIQPLQYREAYAFVEKLRVDNPDIPIYTCGHSLGGGLALNIAMQVRDVSGIGFNPSPRMWFRQKYFPNDLVMFSEGGEALSLFRWTIQGTSRIRGVAIRGNNIESLDYKFWHSWLSEHSIYEMSRVLLAAATTQDEKASIIWHQMRAEAEATTRQ